MRAERTFCRPRPTWTRRRLSRHAGAFRVGAATIGLALATGLGAQNAPIPAPLPGLIETGVPAFIVRAPGALGLGSPPTDMHVLPDGRMLLVAAQELAVGDGERWHAFRRHPATDTVELATVVIDRDGTIYASVAGSFARVVLGEDSHWSFAHVAPFPPEPALAGRVLSHVSAVGDEWYWHGGSGALVAWHPGRAATVLGYMNDLEEVIPAGGSIFVGDPSTGAIYRIVEDRLETFDAAETRKLNRAIVCGAPLPDGRAILGTNNVGALIFDGQNMRLLVDEGPLSGRFRINDLCATAGGFFCAALDNLGLVFFNADGRIVQVLDRSVDHRLARVRRLLYAPGGELWALLNEGLAQVVFPSHVSYFEPLVATGLAYAQPARHQGRLWLLADGRAQRGVYDDSGRLLHFAIDTPGPWVSTILSTGDRLLLATATGIFQREGAGWRLVTDDLINAHITTVTNDPSRWLVVAQDEVAWLRPAGTQLAAERFPVPGMGSSFGTILEVDGVFWAELGASRIARIVRQPDERLETRIFDRTDGLPDGWVQAFVVDGVVRCNVAGRVFRYDAATDRIVADPDFLRDSPELVGVDGRPARDASGRLWLSTNESVSVIDDQARGGGARMLERMPPGFRPIAFTMEESGAVWMHQRQHLVRYDPTMPETRPPWLRAVISHVHLVGSDRHIFFVGPTLPALDYRDNSLVAHFLAPSAVLGHPVTFEVLLKGAGDAWVPTGTAASASFTQLKEGSYVLHVRPRVGSATGDETTLAFSIRPPWYRTTLAYLLYAFAAIAVVLAGTAGWSLLARRKQVRLERIVSKRTAELRQSEERYRRLTAELEQHVAARTAELHGANERLVESNRELEAFSYSVSHDLRAPLRNINGFSELLRKRAAGRIDTETDRYLGIVARESMRLGQLIDSLLIFSRLNRAALHRQLLDLARLIGEVRAELAPETIGRVIDWRIGPLPRITVDPTLMRQVFVNLLHNALKFTRGRNPAVIEIGLQPSTAVGDELVVLYVRDNGAGFDPKFTDKLFGVFQRLHSSRDYEGSGIGLATVRRIVARHGGRVWAEGQPTQGATFFLALPAAAPARGAPAEKQE